MPAVRETAIARAFGARVEATASGELSLFFVVGAAQRPDAAVASVGGEVVMRLADDRKVLAAYPLSVHPALMRDRRIALAGPVNVDRPAFARFMELLGLENHDRDASDTIHDRR